MIVSYLVFIVLTIIVSSIIYKFVKFPQKRILSFILALLFLVLLTVDGLLFMAGSRILWNYHFILLSLNIPLFGLFITYIFHGILCKEKFSKYAYIVSCVFILIYGMVNMSIVHQHNVELHSEKVTQTHRFVFLSDTHEEGAQSFSQLERAVQEINELDVEFVVLGGDITDDYTTKEELERTYEIIGELNAPTYFIYGNHDLQDFDDKYAKGKQYSEAEHTNALTSNGIIILKDQFQQISNDLVIYGRLDRSYKDTRKSYNSINNPKPNACTIVFDHQGIPQFTDDLDHNADFQISGHTHAGQIWPLDLFYRIINYNSVGFYQHNNTTIYISSGFAGWKIPYRTSSQCRYEVFTLSKF